MADLFDSALATGSDARNSAALINGGAAVATLAFLGHLSVNPPRAVLIRGVFALLVFAGGALCAAAASGVTYLAQSARNTALEDGKSTIGIGDRARKVAVALICGAYLAFMAGCAVGAWALYGLL